MLIMRVYTLGIVLLHQTHSDAGTAVGMQWKAETRQLGIPIASPRFQCQQVSDCCLNFVLQRRCTSDESVARQKGELQAIFCLLGQREKELTSFYV